MDAARASVVACLTLILTIMVISGPLVDIDLTRKGGVMSGDVGSGSMTGTVESMPDQAILERGSFGADSYELRVPDATLTIDSVRGQPILSYRVTIPDHGLTLSTTYVLSANAKGVYTLESDTYSITPDQVSADTYTGELEIRVRANQTVRVLERRNITVEVRR